jgi:hypothetical protein
MATFDEGDDFRRAMKAFELFTTSERLRALHIFASLKYPSIEERFFEAVHRVILTLQEP